MSFVDVLKGGAGTREWIFVDTTWGGTYSYAIRDRRFKLVTGKNGEELFDLLNDPWELRNLLDDELDEQAATAYEEFKEELTSLLPDKPPIITRPFPNNM